MTDDEVRDVAIAIRDDRTSFGPEFGQAIIDLIDGEHHYRDLAGWEQFGLGDMRECRTCRHRMSEVEIALLPPKPVPLAIETIYTSLGHRHGGMGISAVVTENGKTLEHTRYERVISYESYQGLAKLGKFRNG
jgi:hypothetical protein